MWKKKFSKSYEGVSGETVWKIMTDINNWPDWHKGLESCHIEGDFKVGNHFILKPKGGREVKIKLTEINKGTSFTDCTKFPGAKMWDTHTLEEKEGKLLVSNSLHVTGPLKWLWIKLVANKVASSIEEKIDTLINLAKKEGK